MSPDKIIGELGPEEIPAAILLQESYGKILDSDRFKKKWESLEYYNRIDFFNGIVEYLSVHPDGFGIDDFIDKKSSIELSSYGLMNRVMGRLGLDNLSTLENQEIYWNYTREKMWKDGFVFHGFNGAFKEQIQQNGLSGDNENIASADISELDKIGRRCGQATLAGCTSSSRGLIYFDPRMKNIHQYATGSPEWFNLFCTGQGLRGHEHKAFVNRNHDLALKNVEQKIEGMKGRDTEAVRLLKAYPNITQEEEEFIKTTFEKYWKKFATDKPNCVALIKRSATFSDRERELEKLSWTEYLSRIKKDPGNFEKGDINFFLDYMSYGVNLSTPNLILPDDIAILDIPDMGIKPEY